MRKESKTKRIVALFVAVAMLATMIPAMVVSASDTLSVPAGSEAILHLSALNLSAGADIEDIVGLVFPGDETEFIAGGVINVVVPNNFPWDHWRGLDIIPLGYAREVPDPPAAGVVYPLLGDDEAIEILPGDVISILVRNTGTANNIIELQTTHDGGVIAGATVAPGATETLTVTITQAHLNAVAGCTAQHRHNVMRLRGSVTNTTWQILDVLISRGGDGATVEPDPTPTADAHYSLLTDAFVQGLSAGVTDLAGTPYLRARGADTVVTVVQHNGSNSLYLSNRAENIDGLQIAVEVQVGDVITVEGRTSTTWAAYGLFSAHWSAMMLNTSGTEWRPHREWQVTWWEPEEPSNPFTLTHTVTAQDIEHINVGGFSINSLAGGDAEVQATAPELNFFIDSIVIEAAAPRAIVALEAPPEDEPGPGPGPGPSGGTIVLTIGSTTATVGGTSVTLTDAPFVGEGDRTMVPFRFIGEALGAEVDWDAATSTAIFIDGANIVMLQIGERLYSDDGTYMGTPVIVGGRTFVPVRFVSTAMGAAIEWDGVARTVTIPN
jgi:hypothetical protein